jgi:hypothetical protein
MTAMAGASACAARFGLTLSKARKRDPDRKADPCAHSQTPWAVEDERRDRDTGSFVVAAEGRFFRRDYSEGPRQ